MRKVFKARRSLPPIAITAPLHAINIRAYFDEKCTRPIRTTEHDGALWVNLSRAVHTPFIFWIMYQRSDKLTTQRFLRRVMTELLRGTVGL